MSTTAVRTKRRILVADDNSAMRRVIVRHLEADDHEVVQAEDGHQLLHWIDLSNRDLASPPFFDVIVTDHRMPGATGLQCLEHLRARGDTTPVLLITAFGDDALHRAARASGAHAVLDKPLDLRVLRAAVRAAL